MSRLLYQYLLCATAMLAFAGDASSTEPPSSFAGRALDIEISELEAKMQPKDEENDSSASSTLDASGITSIARECHKPPTTQAIFSNVKKELSKYKIKTVYESVGPSKIVIYTMANFDKYEASFYYYTADILSCNVSTCDITATAVKIVAPLSDDDNKILLSKAKWWSDYISGNLIDAASPQAMCKAL